MNPSRFHGRKLVFALPVFMLLSAAAAHAAEPPVPGQFAYGAPVRVDGDGAIYELALPVQLYRGVTRSDLSDTAVFNGQGELVPYAIHRPADDSMKDPEPAGAPIFPIYGEPDKKLGGLSLQIKRDNTGAIIDLRESGVDASERKIAAYLMDVSAIQKPMEALELEWRSGGEGFVGKVSIESSDDLHHWSVIVREATVASLLYGGHSLVRKKIALGRRTEARYLRLSWPRSLNDVQLTGVRVEPVREREELPRQWLDVEATLNEGKRNEYCFDTQGRMPVDRIRVRLPQKNTLVSATFFSRATEKDEWRMRNSSLIYDLRVEGEDLVRRDVALPPQPDRYWLMRVDEGGGGLGQGLPRLHVGWVPHQLVFIARGEGPFTLAYGSTRPDPYRHGMDSPLSRFTTHHKDKLPLKSAQAGDRIILGGESMLRPGLSASAWRRWVLWAVLLLGVTLMAWMAVRLYRQMQKQQ